jgi:TolB-like protein/Tfp pilus assembly protein PilF
VGYRVIVPVEATTEESPISKSALPPEPKKEEVASAGKSEAPVLEIRKRKKWIAVVGVAAVLLGLVGYWQWSRTRARGRVESGRVMLAVLPFQNLTGDAGQDYFSDGLTEEMIAQLGTLDPEHIGVIAPTSVAKYKQGNQLAEIAKELRVQYVLEGSVRRDAEMVRVTANLIQVKDQSDLWARQYDRELVNLLGLQREIAEEVAGEIKETLGGGKLSVRATAVSLSANGLAAHDLYLKGLYFSNKRDLAGFRQAIEYFQQAIAKDPNYAPAFAGLANAYTLLTAYSGAQPRVYMPKAREAAQRALELDQNLPEAHTAWALVVQNYDWDWDTSEKEFRRAIELNPNYATAHHWYAEHLAWLGKFDEALQESERARELDPLSLIIATDHGAILYYSRQYERAIEQFQSVREMDPNFPRTGLIVRAYLAEGKFPEAQAEMDRRRNNRSDLVWDWVEEAYVDGRLGKKEDAQRELQKAEEIQRKSQLDPGVLLVATIALGEKDRALGLLEQAYKEHSNVLTTLKVEPIYDPLRGEARFKELIRMVRLGP